MAWWKDQSGFYHFEQTQGKNIEFDDRANTWALIRVPHYLIKEHADCATYLLESAYRLLGVNGQPVIDDPNIANDYPPGKLHEIRQRILKDIQSIKADRYDEATSDLLGIDGYLERHLVETK